jgi:hypothetical protein
MDRNKLLPERIISGFFHFVWLIILIFILIGISPKDLFDYLKEISSGSAALVASLILGTVFFLGNLFDRVITDAVKIYCKRKSIPQKPISELSQLKKDEDSDVLLDLKNSYIDKSFFRSISVAGIFIIISSLVWNYLNDASFNVYLCISIVGIFLEILTFRVFWALRSHFNEVYDKAKYGNPK